MKPTTSVDKTKISFEWYMDGQWILHTPWIPSKAINHALNELRAQTTIIRNISILYKN